MKTLTKQIKNQPSLINLMLVLALLAFAGCITLVSPSPSPPIPSTYIVDDLAVTWLNIDGLIADENGFTTIKMMVQSENDLGDGVIKLINENITGSKGDPVILSELGTDDDKVRIEKRVELTTGTNRVRLIYESNGKTIRSSVVVLSYRDNVIEVMNNFAIGEEGIYWERPQYSPTTVNHYISRLEIKATIISNETIDGTNQVFVKTGGNWRSKPVQARLIRRGPNSNSYDYECTYYFRNEGIEKLELLVERVFAKDKTLNSEPVFFNYLPKKSNLYILAIGVEHGDLKYTGQDAQDVAKLFQSQDRIGMYSEIEIDTLLGLNATASRIREKLEALRSRAKRQYFGLNDLLVVYISSHGYNLNKDFWIKGSNFNPDAPIETSVSYNNSLIPMLDSIACNKLVLIDACQTARKGSRFGAERFPQEYFDKLEAITVITSSKEDQLSYEHKAWENGAFTEAILEALTDAAISVDTDGSSSITPDELFIFLQKRVPSLVANKIGDKLVQVPDMKMNMIGKTPIFYLH